MRDNDLNGSLLGNLLHLEGKNNIESFKEKK